MQLGAALVEAYTTQFYHLMVHAKAKWEDDMVIAMYRHGLHLHIATGLCYARFPTLDDTIQIAYQVKEGLRGFILNGLSLTVLLDS